MAAAATLESKLESLAIDDASANEKAESGGDASPLITTPADASSSTTTTGGSGQEVHALENRWALWFYKNDRQRLWTDNLKQVAEFDTVEQFWSLINHVSPPSRLPVGCDYYLFKAGIKPMWEDRTNMAGGSWLVSVDKVQRASHLDPYWVEVLMMLVGEAFQEDSSEICGAVVNIRNKGDRLSVWTSNCQKEAAIKRIGQKIKETLQLRSFIFYNSHEDAQKKQGSKAKSTHQV